MIRINLLLPSPPPPRGKHWGDFHFGASLGRALAELGADVRLVYAPKRRWLSRFAFRRGIDLLIRAPQRFEPRIWPSSRLVIWQISNTDMSAAELRRAEHIFTASKSEADRLTKSGISASYLPQCTDRDLFSPDRRGKAPREEVLFVGSWRENFQRPLAFHAIAAGFAPKIWGTRWDGKIDPKYRGGIFIENDELGAHYASAGVVLNDHMQRMIDTGMISNRVYDVLASGAELVSDRLPDLGIPLPAARVAATADGVGVAITEALAAQDSRRAARLETAEIIRREHSFHARAAVILARLGNHA